jgi:hypothetical protein
MVCDESHLDWLIQGNVKGTSGLVDLQEQHVGRRRGENGKLQNSNCKMPIAAETAAGGHGSTSNQSGLRIPQFIACDCLTQLLSIF